MALLLRCSNSRFAAGPARGYAGAMHEAMAPPPPETVTVSRRRVVCDGGEGPLGHPRVWLEIGACGFVDCPYCDRRFVLAGPAAAGEAQ